MIGRRSFLLLSLVLPGLALAQPATGTWDVFTHGAKGDGTTLDTVAIQAAIDACSAAGGGRVYLHNGRFRSGTLYLKSHVSLQIEVGATLLGSAEARDYPRTPSTHPGYDGEMLTGKALIYAEDAQHLAILGPGTIDGQGGKFNTTDKGGGDGQPSFNTRPRILHLVGCDNVEVRDVKLVDSGSWVQCYDSCRNLLIDGITVDSRVGHNKDGLDLIDCERVRIANCFISCGDDAICLKSLDPRSGCRDIVVTNCALSSRCFAFKIGTETSGAFENIAVSNCTIFDSREAIGIQTVDGARVENVVISNLTIRNLTAAAIFIRHGARNRPYRKGAPVNAGVLRGITIENIQGTGIGRIGSAIVGLPGHPVENVLLRNIQLTCVGGGTAAESTRTIPELPKSYPKSEMFGVLPAHGFFLRHGNNIQLDNVRLDLAADDARPAVVAEDVAHFAIVALRTSARMKSGQAVRTDSPSLP